MTRRKQIKAGDASKVVGYVRVSTDEQAHGADAQRDALARWCDAHGAELVAVHEDPGVSGGASLDARPGLLAAVDALREHDAGVLLVAKRDRLARDVVLAAMIERLAAREGARVASAAGEGTDGAADDPTALLMRRMVDAFAEYERAIIRARTKAALAAKQARGERTGGIPYGCSLADDGRTLEDNPAELEVMGAARELRAAGLSLRKVGAELEARGLLPRSGGRWHAETVKALLLEAA